MSTFGVDKTISYPFTHHFRPFIRGRNSKKMPWRQAFCGLALKNTV